MNNSETSQTKYPKGVTSLLVVTGLALVFVVMITGLTVLSVRQSRQAQDTDLSNRAIAAAESTARDAAQLIVENPSIELPNCNGTGATGLPDGYTLANAEELTRPQLSSSADNKTSIACRTITVRSDAPSGFIKQDESTQFFTYQPTNTGVNRMVLRWGKHSPLEAYTLNNADSYPASLSNNTPALIELSLIYWPKSGTISNSLPVINRLIVPTSTPTDFSTVAPGASYLSSPSTVCDGTVANGYNCQATINLDQFFTATGYNIVVKLRPRYKDTNFQAQFYNASAPTTPVTVRSSRALIDVTTKVGDLYRRIQAEMPLENNSFFDDVLYSNTHICKNLQVDSAFSITKDNTCPSS